jgi:hypothetical protein
MLQNLNTLPSLWSSDHLNPHIAEGLKKKPKARKFTDHRTISLTAHAAKVVASVLRRRSEKKIEGILGRDQIGFRKEKSY